MATSTLNNQFVKPDYTDPADIAVINANFDKLDAMVSDPGDGGIPYELSGEVIRHNGQHRAIHGIADTHKLVLARQLGFDPYKSIEPLSWQVCSSQTVTDGTLYITYYTPIVDVVASKFYLGTAGTPASGATLATMAAFIRNTDTSLTQIATTGDVHTTLGIATNHFYTPSFTNGKTVFRGGITYGFSAIFVGSGLTVEGKAAGVSTLGPTRCHNIAAQPSMPTSISASALVSAGLGAIALNIGVTE